MEVDEVSHQSEKHVLRTIFFKNSKQEMWNKW
jgi:hypothetical protein